MFRRLSLAAAVGSAALVVTALAPASAAPSTHGGPNRHAARVCSAPDPGQAACHDQVVVDASGTPVTNATPAGLTPSDIESAYKLARIATHPTVAIVDAYNAPNAESDLGKYRSQFGLPACTTSNGCFRKVNQNGSTSYPRTDAGWATEISLDLDMVSAACPDCRILLVEASSASFSSLGAAVNYAAGQSGVVAISNSYGGSDSSASSAYNHPGIAVVASTGDSGYGVQSPASYGSVVAVGGTSLRRDGSARGWAETAWSGAGSGCSRYNAKPSWQSSTSCNGKANADVSAVADPYTGVAVYDSTPYNGRSGWQIYGGTSAASPIVASVYALSGNTAGNPASYTWAHAGGLNDVTSGSNGSCSPALWCTAGTGWDGPTGLGTPNGTSAF